MTKKRRVIHDNSQASVHDRDCLFDEDLMEYEQMKTMLMTAMAETGVTPDEYAAFLADDKSRSKHMGMLRSMVDDFSFGGNRSHCVAQEVHALPDADKKSLRLKVQMKNISKPPMWREIVIPADFNFSQLHHAIQAVTGLENCHLWQFQHQAYNPDLQIGVPMDDAIGFGLDEWTHDADVTPVTGFLAKKGDKLEYLYDFGDDWIFTVTVLEVMDRDGDVAVCTKWKSELHAVEDCGGVEAYLQLRDFITDHDKLTAKQKKAFAEAFGFDSSDRLSAWIEDYLMDIEYVNERLSELPESGRMDE